MLARPGSILPLMSDIRGESRLTADRLKDKARLEASGRGGVDGLVLVHHPCRNVFGAWIMSTSTVFDNNPA